MARDFEDIHDLDDLSDDELRDLVRQHPAANNTLDVGELTVRAQQGKVLLGGRVGTDEERRVAEHVVTDVLGIEECENGILLHSARPLHTSEDVEEHLAEEERESGLLLGDRPAPMEPSVEEVADDLDAGLFGTTDVGKSIVQGTAWIPPESPTPEGLTEPGELGEDR